MVNHGIRNLDLKQKSILKWDESAKLNTLQLIPFSDLHRLVEMSFQNHG